MDADFSSVHGPLVSACVLAGISMNYSYFSVVLNLYTVERFTLRQDGLQCLSENKAVVFMLM